MRIGMLGGTFNPPHLGHLALAEESLRRFELDKVVFIPAFIPPHKDVAYGVSSQDRMEMVRLAVAGEPTFEISTYEMDKEGISYSIESIEHFQEKYGPRAELFFLTGADSISVLSTWKEIDRILELTTFVVASRPGWRIEGPYEGKVKHLGIPEVDISSSMIRECVKDAKSIDGFVLPMVAEYIKKKGLYSSS